MGAKIDMARKLLEEVPDRNKHVAHFAGDGELAFIDLNGSAIVFWAVPSGSQVKEGTYSPTVEMFNEIAEDYNLTEANIVTEHPEARDWGLFPYQHNRPDMADRTQLY